MSPVRAWRVIALFLVVALWAVPLPGPVSAAEVPQTVEEIVHRANLASYFRARDGRAQVSMTITDNQGRVRNREVTVLRRDAAESDGVEGTAYLGDQSYYIYFHRPADVSGMAFVVWKHQDRDDDRWLYLPALDLVRRIAASDKRTSFAGSDFFYEDVSGRNVDADVHELVQTTNDYFVVRNRPKQAELVEFSYYDVYIHKTTFLPIRTVYFGRRNDQYRVYTALRVDTIQGISTVTGAKMQDLRTGSTTEITYKDVRYDIGLPDDLFTERFLRRPPTQYLR